MHQLDFSEREKHLITYNARKYVVEKNKEINGIDIDLGKVKAYDFATKTYAPSHTLDRFVKQATLSLIIETEMYQDYIIRVYYDNILRSREDCINGMDIVNSKINFNDRKVFNGF